MNRTIVTAAEDTPVGLTEVKDYLRVTGSAEDDTITALIESATDYVEQTTGRALVTQTWDVFFDFFPYCGDLRLPLGQLQSVESFAYTDADGNTTSVTISSGDLLIDGITFAHIQNSNHRAGLFRLAFGAYWPTNILKASDPIAIRGVFGWAVPDVPRALKHAIKQLVSHWYDNRETVALSRLTQVVEVPHNFEALIANYKLHR